MCLLVIAWHAHADLPLVIAANRDEFHARPSAPLAWWQPDERLLAGRDLTAGGTWLGITRDGRVGALTNFRDPRAARPDAPSRGSLIPRFAASPLSPHDFVQQVLPQAADFAGFNLLVGDHAELGYLASRPEPRWQPLSPGIYGLSNHLLDTPWPKLTRLRERVSRVLGQASDPAGALFELLTDREPALGPGMPDSLGDPALDRALSAPFVVNPRYGTRCSTVVTVDRAGRVRAEERLFDPQGMPCGTTAVEFDIDRRRDDAPTSGR
jgi:uncharacterized protein with NRDE domain